MVRLSHAGAYVGAKPVRAIYRGAVQLWRQKFRSFTEKFDALDPNLWDNPSPTHVKVVNGRLSVNSTVDWWTVWALPIYDLTESSVAVEVAQLATSPDYIDTYIVLQGPNSAQIDMDIETNGGVTVLTFYWVNPGAPGAWLVLGNVPYDPIAMRWLRFRHSQGMVYGDTSPDGLAWTQRFAWTPTFVVDNLQLALGAGGNVTGMTPALFDNINVFPN